MARFIVSKVITNTIIVSMLSFIWIRFVDLPNIVLGTTFTFFAFLYFLFAWCWYLKKDSFTYFQEKHSLGFLFKNKIKTPSKTKQFLARFKIDDSQYVADQSILEISDAAYDRICLLSNAISGILFLVLGQILSMVL